MSYNTKIDWCDTTWNPVTGCYHGCKYCYARGIANRFSPRKVDTIHGNDLLFEDGLCTIEKPVHRYEEFEGFGRDLGVTPYPLGFVPTFHRYRLGQPSKWSEPRTIFVCSMADLFGKWVPDEWIRQVVATCLAAPQHKYLFLTKNPVRYVQLIEAGIIPESQPNFWLGSTATTPEKEFFWHDSINTFVSIEPILAPFVDLTDACKEPATHTNWIIVGAETGNRKNKVIPEKSWIMELADCAKKTSTPIFMKESLRRIMGDDFIQQYPWEV